MQLPEVFVIAPLDPEGQRVQDTVRRAVQEAGLTVVHHRHALHPGAEMTSSILDSIRRADLIIADVSRQNPNVLYEIGFAHALRKPTILLFDTASEYKLPSDLAGLEYIPYTAVNLTALADRVKSETKELIAIRRSA
jgi:hypothetical protein